MPGSVEAPAGSYLWVRGDAGSADVNTKSDLSGGAAEAQLNPSI